MEVAGRDPNRFPVPVVGVLAPGASAVTQVTVAGGRPLRVSVSADGGRTTATVHTGHRG